MMRPLRIVGNHGNRRFEFNIQHYWRGVTKICNFNDFFFLFFLQILIFLLNLKISEKKKEKIVIFDRICFSAGSISILLYLEKKCNFFVVSDFLNSLGHYLLNNSQSKFKGARQKNINLNLVRDAAKQI